MNIEDSSDLDRMHRRPAEHYFEDIDHSVNKETKMMKSNHGLFSQTKIPFLIGGGLLVVIVMIIMFFPKTENSNDMQQLESMEKRIQNLESVFEKTEQMGEGIAMVEKQNQRIDIFMNRYAKLQSDLSLKINLIEKKLDKLKVSETAGIKKKLPVKTEKGLHTVTTGETLYSISKKFGVTIDELRNMNKSLNSNSIYPGQKLRLVK
jgi:LysM repeat protein